MTIAPGIYRHYKGPHYQVIGVARHSETEESLVVYRPLYGARELWVRPLEMFTGSVEVGGETVPRFSWVGPDEQQVGDDPAAAGIWPAG
ncbi:MAG: DUF1653 domain-containing protein [Spongiibacteraceae bacterium]|jgi:hypothetical protein|nr:DUF1653 domain-containing protein [Spongiibacteraceae bacterium]